MGNKMKNEELYKKYRPKKIGQIVGQENVRHQISEWIENQSVPHTILMHGPSGTGKTTTARILARELGCESVDLTEMNAAEARGIDDIRRIESRMGLAPMVGKCRVWIIDEAHKLTSDSQNAFLKPLEDTPDHVYFILCSTNPEKLIKTIRTRSSELRFSEMSKDEVAEVVEKVAKKEKIKLSDEVIDKITEVSAGSARKALVLLQAIIKVEDQDEQLDRIEKSDTSKMAIDLWIALLNPRVKWPDIAKILSSIKEDEESIRRIVLSCCVTAMGCNPERKSRGRSSPDRCYIIIQAFRDDYFSSGRAGLVASCYEIVCRP